MISIVFLALGIVPWRSLMCSGAAEAWRYCGGSGEDKYVAAAERVCADTVMSSWRAIFRMKWQRLHTSCALASSVASLPSSGHVLHENREVTCTYRRELPTENIVQTVKDWLLHFGTNKASILAFVHKGWLALDLPAQQADKVFSTQYFERECQDGGRIGCGTYYLLAHVSEHIDFIKFSVYHEKTRYLSRQISIWGEQGRLLMQSHI